MGNNTILIFDTPTHLRKKIKIHLKIKDRDFIGCSSTKDLTFFQLHTIYSPVTSPNGPKEKSWNSERLNMYIKRHARNVIILNNIISSPDIASRIAMG